MSEFYFDGIYCPSVTPFLPTGAIDYDGWGAHLDHLVSAGVTGILIFGSIGEFYAIPLAQKKQAIAWAAERAAGKVQLLVGIGSTNYQEVLDLAATAEKNTATAVVAVSPYYFGPSPECAVSYFAGISKANSLPIVLYNFPARTGTDLTPELVARIAREMPQVKAIKDTVDTISHTRKIIEAVRTERPDFCVLSGFDEYYVPNRIAGGNGVISGLVNVEPETLVAMNRAWQAGNYAQAIACAKRVSHLMALYDKADLFVSAVKGGIRAKGLAIETLVAEPAIQLTAEQFAAIEMLLAE